MRSLLTEPGELTARAHPRAGWIARIADGRLWVDFRGNAREPLKARFVAGAFSGGAPAEGQPVLLLFENDDSELPIVVGVILESVDSPFSSEMELRAPKSGEVMV